MTDWGVSLGHAVRKGTTDKAVFFETEDVGDVCVPKSQIHERSEIWEVGDEEGELYVKTWFARERGWL
jgi:hypothetical protein